MKNNELLQKDVQEAIKWEPLLSAAEIGVTAKDGVITLSGTVDSYAKKLEAESAAKSVAGVKAVVEKITVKFGGSWNKTDNEIAGEVLHALKSNWQIPTDTVKVTVEAGWITLAGELNHSYQKDAAKNAIKNLMGVVGVTNNITINPLTHDEIEKEEIERALSRNWSINDTDIHVKVSGHDVTLSGKVDSFYQKDEAERIAFNAPGVWSVDNALVIEYNYSLSL